MKFIQSAFRFAAYLVCGFTVIFGACVLLYQCYVWLRFSAWMPVSIMSALEWLEVPWAFSPTDWFGLYDLFKFVPLSIAVPALGLVVGGMFEMWAEELGAEAAARQRLNNQPGDRSTSREDRP